MIKVVDEVKVDEGTETVRKERTKNIVKLVEVVTDELTGGTIFKELSIPDSVKTLNRAEIMREVAKAAERGDTTYDNKDLAVVSFQPPKRLVSEVVRRTRFE